MIVRYHFFKGMSRVNFGKSRIVAFNPSLKSGGDCHAQFRPSSGTLKSRNLFSIAVFTNGDIGGDFADGGSHCHFQADQSSAKGKKRYLFEKQVKKKSIFLVARSSIECLKY